MTEQIAGHNPFQLPKAFVLKAGGKMLDLSKPVVMGILNLSPDSFYAGSRVEGEKLLLSQAEKMLTEGALILDLGAMSSRPGAAEISEGEETNLLVPAIRSISQAFPEILISADVFRPAATAAALDAGAHIINNIHGLSASDSMMRQISEAGAAYILMHSRGNFSEMHRAQHYENLVAEVGSELAFAIHRAREAGITDVVADPGFGFSKDLQQNFGLFRELSFLTELLDCPILIGVSRKSMIYRSLNCGPEEALNGTTALHMAALMQGVHILRTHDVKEAAETIQLFLKLCSPES